MRVLLTGASGGLGTYVLEELVARGHEVVGWSGRSIKTRGSMTLTPIDLTDQSLLTQRLDEANAELILHLAAISSAEEVRREADRARRVNVEATGTIARWCSAHHRRLIFTSTDMVFGGSRSWSREEDLAEPISAYGRTKREAEEHVRRCPRGLVLRVSLLYGFSGCGRPAFFDRAIDDLKLGKPRSFFEDEFRTPLSLGDAAAILARLAEIDANGTLHVAGRERLSRFELMRSAAVALGLDASLVRADRREAVASTEPRPADLSLDTTKLATLLPDFRRRSIEEFLLDRSFSQQNGSIQ